MTQVLLRLFLFLGGFEMELIRKLGTRKRISKNRKKYVDSYGLFLCPYCNKEVEKELGSGKIQKSCGCAHDKLTSEAKTKHGDAKNGHLRLYRIWSQMKQRCYNKNDDGYKWYGVKGITIHPYWKNSYIVFKKWALENGYRDNLEIDRINNNGNYEPSNCKWSTRKEQARNTRQNRWITYKGETHCLTDWAEILKMSESLLHYRISNWNVERAFTTKVNINLGKRRK